MTTAAAAAAKKKKKSSKVRVSKRAFGFGTMADPCVSCTTFNILAPIYKRLDKEVEMRERNVG